MDTGLIKPRNAVKCIRIQKKRNQDNSFSIRTKLKRMTYIDFNPADTGITVDVEDITGESFTVKFNMVQIRKLLSKDQFRQYILHYHIDEVDLPIENKWITGTALYTRPGAKIMFYPAIRQYSKPACPIKKSSA